MKKKKVMLSQLWASFWGSGSFALALLESSCHDTGKSRPSCQWEEPRWGGSGRWVTIWREMPPGEKLSCPADGQDQFLAIWMRFSWMTQFLLSYQRSAAVSGTLTNTIWNRRSNFRIVRCHTLLFWGLSFGVVCMKIAIDNWYKGLWGTKGLWFNV